MDVVTDLQPNPWAGPNGRRRRRIHQELRYLGETRRWWSDACRFIEDDTLETGAHMALHALRELDGTLLALLVPIANVTEDPEHAKERQRLAEVLADAGFSKDVIVGAQGRLPPGAKEKYGAVCRMLRLDARSGRRGASFSFIKPIGDISGCGRPPIRPSSRPSTTPSGS